VREVLESTSYLLGYAIVVESDRVGEGLTLSISRTMSRLVASSHMSSPYVNGEIPVVVAGFVCFYFLAPRDADIALCLLSFDRTMYVSNVLDIDRRLRAPAI
jgi:hypothetical protein